MGGRGHSRSAAAGLSGSGLFFGLPCIGDEDAERGGIDSIGDDGTLRPNGSNAGDCLIGMPRLLSSLEAPQPMSHTSRKYRGMQDSTSGIDQGFILSINMFPINAVTTAANTHKETTPRNKSVTDNKPDSDNMHGCNSSTAQKICKEPTGTRRRNDSTSTSMYTCSKYSNCSNSISVDPGKRECEEAAPEEEEDEEEGDSYRMYRDDEAERIQCRGIDGEWHAADQQRRGDTPCIAKNRRHHKIARRNLYKCSQPDDAKQGHQRRTSIRAMLKLLLLRWGQARFPFQSGFFFRRSECH